jgi:hypothetical protein
MAETSTEHPSSSDMTWAGKNVAWAMNNDKGKKTIRAAYYAAQVFYSFFVM